jgi:dipeptidyl aminopeptidase/acylaminoacyl peptidase
MRPSAKLIMGVVLSLTLGAIAVQAQQFSLADVLSVPFPSDLRASPDGNRLAWLVDDRGRRNVWAAELPQLVARPLTSFSVDDGQALSALTWSPDSDAIVFVKGEGRNNAGEVPNPTSDPAGMEQSIWMVRFSGGLPRELAVGSDPDVSTEGVVAFSREGQIWTVPLSGSSPPQQAFKARGRNSAPAWSPEGRTLAFVSEREDHSFIVLYRPGDRALHYLSPSVDRDSAPRWSPDGKKIAFVRQPGRGGELPPPGAENVPLPWSIWAGEPGTLRARQIWESGNAPEASIPRLAEANILQWGAGGRLIYASENDGWLHLYSTPASGGESLLLTPGNCEVESLAYSQDRSAIVYSANCGDIDRRHLFRVPVSGGSPVALTSGETIEWGPAVLSNGMVAFQRSDARLPAAPYLLNPSTRQTRPLVPDWTPKSFPASALVVPEPVLFKSADNWEIHGQLFLPTAARSGRLPAVIFMHGGPVRQMLLGWHNRYYYHNAYGMNQYLANRGYAVLSVNYRSGIGYGRAFREAPARGARGASEYQDIVAAASYLRSRQNIDATRIGLWGGSYGGYLTALGLARNSDLFAAGVDLHGVHDWSSRRFRPQAGTESPEVIRRAKDSSPISSVEKWKSPVLLIHGDDDRNVDFSQTVDLVQRLRAQKVEFEQIVFPDEIHDFLLHRHWVEAFEAGAGFFDRHLNRGQTQIDATK